jgi:flavin-dependent dehydrogenase
VSRKRKQGDEVRTFDESNDVLVIGGGPGGATVATLLARAGRRCVLLESSKFPRYHVGESLIPHTHGVFERLGLLPKLKVSVFPVKHSVRFVGRSGLASAPFYFSETISGERATTWQVSRPEFDELMLGHALENGVIVAENCRVDRVLFEGDRAVGVVAECDGSGSRQIRAKVVVDASGRSTVIGRQLRLRAPVPGLRKTSSWAYYRGGERLPGIDAGETTIFRVSDDAWFWYIPLAEDIVSVGIVGDPERFFTTSGNIEEIFQAHVEKCGPLTDRLTEATRIGPVRGLKELSYLNRQTCGDGWVMIGDARAFLDPIYSSGIYLALGSAELAAECVDQALEIGDVSAKQLGKFEPGLWKGVEVIRRLIHAFYDPAFSFQAFSDRFPEQRAALIDCLVGDVLKDMTSFTAALAQMTPPPPALAE